MRHERGAALTLLAMTQFLVVLDMTVVNVAVANGAAGDPAALTAGFRSGFLGAAAFALVAALIAALLLPRPREAASLSLQPKEGT